MSDGERGDDEPMMAVVLDYLPHGRADDDRPQYQKSPVAYAVGEENFRLVELQVEKGSAPGIDDLVAIDPPEESFKRVRYVDYDDMSGGARSEIEYVVADIVEENEGRFVDFYNEAQPITLRLHQLNLLPGIGKKLRNTILDERKRKPFESFEDLEERVSGLHNPKEVLVDRILEELREEDLKYRLFVRQEHAEE